MARRSVALFGCWLLSACGGRSSLDRWSPGSGGSIATPGGSGGESGFWTVLTDQDRPTAYAEGTALWSPNPGDVWLAHQATEPPSSRLAHFDGESWSDQGLSAGESHSIWASARDDVYVILEDSSSSVMRWNGQVWSPLADTIPLGAISGSSSRNIWAISRQAPPTISLWNGQTWARVTNLLGIRLRDVDAQPGGDAWAVGEAGFVAHYDGAWSTRYVGTADLLAVWSASPDAIWIADSEGSVHFHGPSGSGWLSTRLSTGVWYDVWGRSADDVWLVGAMGQARHWDGSEWSIVTLPTQNTLRAVSGNAEEIWIAGDGVLLRGRAR